MDKVLACLRRVGGDGFDADLCEREFDGALIEDTVRDVFGHVGLERAPGRLCDSERGGGQDRAGDCEGEHFSEHKIRPL